MSEPLVDIFSKALDRYKAEVDASKKIAPWKKAETKMGIKATADSLQAANGELAAMTPPNPDALFKIFQENLATQQAKSVTFEALGIPTTLTDTLSTAAKAASYFVIETTEAHKYNDYVGRGYQDGKTPREFQGYPLTPTRLMIQQGEEFGVLADIEDNKGLPWSILVQKQDFVPLLQATNLLP